MQKRTTIVAVMMFGLFASTQMQGMDRSRPLQMSGGHWLGPNEASAAGSSAHDYRMTSEEAALECCWNNPYRFGPISIDSITAQDLADIQCLSHSYDIRTYINQRTRMAKAGRQRHGTFMDCNGQGRDDEHINSIFGAAICKEDLFLAKDLLEHGANPNEKIDNNHGWMELPIFEIGTVPMLDLLVAHQAQLNKHNRNGYPLVHHAVETRSPEFLERLLQYPEVNVNAQRGGNNVTRRYNGGASYAVSYANLPIWYRADSGDTPLHIWAKKVPFDLQFSGMQKQLMILIRAGVNVTSKNNDELTALGILRMNLADSGYFKVLPEVKQRVAILAAQLAALMPPQPQADVAISQEQGQSTCVICMEDFQELDNRTALPCAHVFHTACLQPWISAHHNCPSCRTEVEG